VEFNFVKKSVQRMQQFKLFQVNMQLYIEYSQIMNQIFHQQLKCFNDEYQMPIAYSVFKQTVHNVIAHQLQQPTIEICCKKNDTIA